MQARWASQDREGLREALWSWMTRPPQGSRASTGRGGGSPPVAYAFELWIAHLALLEQVLELTPASWPELRAAEVDGLLLLRAARQRYSREYRACGECGAAMNGRICPRCGALSENK